MVTDYGRTSLAAERRRWLHRRLTEMLVAAELPTTISSLYYDGVGATPAPWLSDEADLKAKVAKARAAGKRPPSKPRTPRQDVSYDVQWLIDHGLVAESAVVDLSRNLIDHWAPLNLRDDVRDYAANRTLRPWALDQPQPVIIVESRSLAGAIEGTIQRYAGLLVPLGGMPGRSYLRELNGMVDPKAPIAYLGDYNKPGDDISAHVRGWLGSHGWEDRRGRWTLLAVTDADARRLPSKLKIDGRTRAGTPGRPSIEAEALGTTTIRNRVTGWLDRFLPAGFSWDAHDERTSAERAAVLALLDAS